jgi:hypothetical protein
VLFTGATTGLVYVVGKTARDAGCFHVGISPGTNELEHVRPITCRRTRATCLFTPDLD